MGDGGAVTKSYQWYSTVRNPGYLNSVDRMQHILFATGCFREDLKTFSKGCLPVEWTGARRVDGSGGGAC